MKRTARNTLLLLSSLGATFAVAASNNIPQVQHVIIVIQENRTPTNLFHEDTTLFNNGGHVRPPGDDGLCGTTQVPLTFTPLYTCWDPYHNHASWTAMWDNGKMDGACNIGLLSGNCQGQTPPCVSAATCPYTYVQNTVWGNGYGILDPYFQIANQYGFANFMFQTNQGPSFPAHQFLFSGTSAPVPYNDTTNCDAWPNEKCWQWFDAENASLNFPTGCVANQGAYSKLIEPNSQETKTGYTPPPPVNSPAFPCYDHATLTDLLDNAQPAAISWKYYARKVGQLWTAPTAINHICDTSGYGGICQGTDYWDYPFPKVVVPGTAPGADQAPILTDIANCTLPQVSFVIPDGNWSDHAGPGNSPGDGGPSWVAAIVNAVGNSWAQSAGGGVCDYWGSTQHASQPTVILVTWDDWGGYYDDVVPPNCGPGQSCGYPNSGNPPNGVQYVYGFRVPLLVVSAYATPGYISGTPSQGGEVPPYLHDFGSILNFIEYAFGQNGSPLGAPFGIGDPNWPYADYFAPDGHFEDPSSPYSLYDFFNFSAIQTPTFMPITGWKYRPGCFHNPEGQGCGFLTYPLDPDNDANESD